MPYQYKREPLAQDEATRLATVCQKAAHGRTAAPAGQSGKQAGLGEKPALLAPGAVLQEFVQNSPVALTDAPV
jgi:hypothetical protein